MSEYTKNELIEKLAAALRRFETKKYPIPDFFICTEEEYWEYFTEGNPTICGIPLVFSIGNFNIRGYGDIDNPIIPAWKRPENGSSMISDFMRYFEEGY